MKTLAPKGCNLPSGLFVLLNTGKRVVECHVSSIDSYFHDINVLGMDVMLQVNWDVTGLQRIIPIQDL
jgi:hypothetical protein